MAWFGLVLDGRRQTGAGEKDGRTGCSLSRLVLDDLGRLKRLLHYLVGGLERLQRVHCQRVAHIHSLLVAGTDVHRRR